MYNGVIVSKPIIVIILEDNWGLTNIIYTTGMGEHLS